MVTKTYEAVGTDVQVLRVKQMVIKLKPGESAQELLDKMESLIKRFSEDGNWNFKFSVDS